MSEDWGLLEIDMPADCVEGFVTQLDLLYEYIKGRHGDLLVSLMIHPSAEIRVNGVRIKRSSDLKEPS